MPFLHHYAQFECYSKVPVGVQNRQVVMDEQGGSGSLTLSFWDSKLVSLSILPDA